MIFKSFMFLTLLTLYFCEDHSYGSPSDLLVGNDLRTRAPRA